jgi:hypothetical protein
MFKFIRFHLPNIFGLHVYSGQMFSCFISEAIVKP